MIRGTGRDRNSIISTPRCHKNLNRKCCYVTALGAQWTVDWNILEKSDKTKQVPVEFCLDLSNTQHFWTLWGLHIPSVWHHCVSFWYLLANCLHSPFLWFLLVIAVGPATGQCTAEMRSPGVQKGCPMAHNVAFVGHVHVGNSWNFQVFLALLGTVHQPSLPFARLV